MEPEVKFVGVKIPPKTSVPVDESLEPGTYFSTLHITQFALAENARPGRNTISLKTPHGETFVLGTLQKDRCEQFQVPVLTELSLYYDLLISLVCNSVQYLLMVDGGNTGNVMAHMNG